ncbi:hypothetical protein [Phenylobacterium aquaticum]|uniref:hypothetical protein n=1 Tax=Phenylobacterium aquaticum TaxID=1763816 RepID=UPI001F5CD059|nr:hypothetical protein [Phenylobacterium aquaticum]MCI3132361.1 hypothetical protein [Phenylobacterium aquaticum]
MRRSTPKAFDHGAALRVPGPEDSRSWRALQTWLGECGAMIDPSGLVQVATPLGQEVARPGDWIVLSVSGDFHVARTRGQTYDA